MQSGIASLICKLAATSCAAQCVPANMEEMSRSRTAEVSISELLDGAISSRKFGFSKFHRIKILTLEFYAAKIHESLARKCFAVRQGPRPLRTNQALFCGSGPCVTVMPNVRFVNSIISFSCHSCRSPHAVFKYSICFLWKDKKDPLAG